MLTIHEHFMQEAIYEAQRADAIDTHPNPRVGCIITHNDKIIARGYHKRDGEAHAEIDALRNLTNPLPQGATIYVTLEPCSTHGRTGACCEAIVRAGLKKVYIGSIDPNPKHKGNGINILRESGIMVIDGVLNDLCKELNPEFNRRMHSIDNTFNQCAS